MLDVGEFGIEDGEVWDDFVNWVVYGYFVFWSVVLSWEMIIVVSWVIVVVVVGLSWLKLSVVFCVMCGLNGICMMVLMLVVFMS